MKRIILFTFLSISFLVLNASETGAQVKNKKVGPSLLYRVTGNSLGHPSYIFGTFHAICSADMVPFESLDTYLSQSDQLMMEIDMDDAGEMQSMTKAIIIPEGRTLKDLLTPEQFAKVDEMTKDLLGYPVESLKRVKPSMLTVMALTSPKAIGCTPTAYDLLFVKAAIAKKKPIVGLETVASQVKVIDSKPLQKQANDLYEMALNPQKAINELKQVMAVYKLRDPDRLLKLTNRLTTDDKKFQARLINERNAAWISKLEIAFTEKPTFVAVGAGHLGGDKGVIRLLRKKGYRIEPIKL